MSNTHIDLEIVTAATEGLADDATTERYPASLGKVDTHHAASTETLAKLDTVARALPPAIVTQMSLVATAIDLVAYDVQAADGQ